MMFFISFISLSNLLTTKLSIMKKLLFLLLACFIVASCTTEKKELKYTLKINVDTIVDGYAYLQKRAGGEWIKFDSSAQENASYVMQGVLDFPSMYYVFIKDIKRNVPIFLDAGDITIEVFKDDYDATTITGSPAHDQYKGFEDEIAVFDEKLHAIYQEYRTARDSGLVEVKDSLSQVMDGIYEEQQAFIKEYVFNNNANVTSPYITYSNSYSWTVDELENIVNNFDPSLEASPDYIFLADRLVVLKRVDIGQPLVDFAMKDTNDIDIHLSELSKGKYLLVDFWASWCGPCRTENPNIVACYNDFHEKGFDVLGVSFDKSRENWIQAIHNDSLSWNHVSDLLYWNNAAGKLYGVRSIPSSILLDPDGIIIAKNLHGEELREKLEELMP